MYGWPRPSKPEPRTLTLDPRSPITEPRSPTLDLRRSMLDFELKLTSIILRQTLAVPQREASGRARAASTATLLLPLTASMAACRYRRPTCCEASWVGVRREADRWDSRPLIRGTMTWRIRCWRRRGSSTSMRGRSWHRSSICTSFPASRDTSTAR